jgi:hypothetical protein
VPTKNLNTRTSISSSWHFSPKPEASSSAEHPPNHSGSCRSSAPPMALARQARRRHPGMISGEPGSGKTWVRAGDCHRVEPWTKSIHRRKTNAYATLYASMEHDSSEVIHPRFAKLNGDPARPCALNQLGTPKLPMRGLKVLRVLKAHTFSRAAPPRRWPRSRS